MNEEREQISVRKVNKERLTELVRDKVDVRSVCEEFGVTFEYGRRVYQEECLRQSEDHKDIPNLLPQGYRSNSVKVRGLDRKGEGGGIHISWKKIVNLGSDLTEGEYVSISLNEDGDMVIQKSQ